jgi:hypothetical protein
MRLTLLLSTLAFVCALAATAAAVAQELPANFRVPAVAETAAAAEGFVPKGWRLLGKAAGDLNGDGLADAVVVAAHDVEGSGPEDVWEEPRLLVIALAEPGGRLRRSAVSADVVMCRGCGGVFGDPFESAWVERGTVVVHHYGGSRDRWAYTDRFRLQDGAWRYIGATYASTDNLDLSYEESRDANLSTGLVIERGKRGRRSYNRTFYEVRAGRAEKPPVLDGTISEGEWAGDAVRLVTKENVVAGAAAWAGADDASARVGAQWRGEELYLRAEVTDDSVTPADAVRVVSMAGQVVRPVELKTASRAKGYAVEARYTLKSLGIDAIEARLKELRGYGAAENTLPKDRVLRVAVEVVDADPAQKTATVLSTSRGGPKYPGTVRLTPRPGPPLLSDFNREDAIDVMPVPGLPEVP